VESRNYLGIYWARDRATVVALAAQGRDWKLLDAFSVSVANEPEQGPSALADRIGRACSERNVKFGAAGVALDCEMFMQHTVRSEFQDEKKIAATVRFDTEDTEEALATDISEVAVAFRITSSDEEGSTLDVYTAQRSDLSDLLFSLQGHGIDPVTVDPDVYCLSQYLRTYGGGESSESRPLYALLSDSRGYLVSPAELRFARLSCFAGGIVAAFVDARVSRGFGSATGPVAGAGDSRFGRFGRECRKSGPALCFGCQERG